MNVDVAKDCQTVLKLINIWFYFFKNGIDLSALSHMARKRDADQATSRASMPYLRSLGSQFSINNIYNNDEFGLSYSAAPLKHHRSRLSPWPEESERKSRFFGVLKYRRTFNFPFILVGKAKRLRVFSGRSGAREWFDYDYGGVGG